MAESWRRFPLQWVSAHVLLPLGLFSLFWYLLVAERGDFRLAGLLLEAQGGSWVFKQHPVTEGAIHAGGRWLSGMAWLGLLLFYIGAGRFNRSPPWRARLRYLLISVVCSVALVSGIKRLSAVDCPWDVDGFGGNRPAVTSAEPRPAGLAPGHCFPAGHASLGYAWLALYFAAFGSASWRRWGLATGIGLGLVFGVSQQMRGAHFASHDLATALLCWGVAMAWLPLLRRPAGPGVPS